MTTKFFEADMHSHAEKFKKVQARVNSGIDSAIEQVALYEETPWETLKEYKDEDKNTLQTMKDGVKEDPSPSYLYNFFTCFLIFA